MIGPAPAGSLQPLSVVHLTGFYPPHTGGVEQVAEHLAIEASRRHRVEVLTSAVGGRAGAEVVSPTLTVRRYRNLRVLDTPLFPQAAVRLWRVPAPAVLHVHVTQGFVTELGALAAAAGAAMVAHFHMEVEPSFGGGGLYRAYKRRVLGPVLRRADRVAVLDDTQASWVAGTYGVDPEAIAVVPNGVGTPAPGAGPARPPAPGEVLRLLFVGRLAPQKNLPRLLAAVAALRRPWELVVVGDGPEAPVVAAAADRVGGGRISATGRQTPAEVAAWMARSHLLVSSSDNEGTPLVFLEAMAAGLPIVATDVVGSRQTLAGAGLLVPADPAGLAAGVERLAGDAAQWAAAAAAGRRMAAGRSWAASGALMDRIYEDALRHRRCKGLTPLGR